MKKRTITSFAIFNLIALTLIFNSSCLFVDYHRELSKGNYEDVNEEIKDVHEDYCECKEKADKIINEAVRFDEQFRCKSYPLSWAAERVSTNKNLTESEVRTLIDKILNDAPCRDLN